MKLKTVSSIALIVAACAGALGAGVAMSQVAPLPAVEWDVRRLDTLDRNVRRLERALTQRNAVGQPVLVEPDPEVVTLMGQMQQVQAQVGDLQTTVRNLNAELERITFQGDEASRTISSLRTRLNEAENRIKTLEDAKVAAEAAARAAQEAERSPTGSAAGDLEAAQTLITSDPAGAAVALDKITVNWPDTPQAREANLRLGDLRRAGNDMAGAVSAYAAALQGWPTTPWAGETTLKLARVLIATDRKPQACGALGEFNRRYLATASSDLKTIATRIRTEASCR